jgi:hypothetical protein
VSLCEFAINGSVQASTGNTPFFLNYGQEPLTPLTDLAVPSARVFADGLNHAIRLARQSLEQAVQRQKAHADRGRRDVQFKVGDQVLLSTKNLKFKAVGTSKFLPRYIGPLTVSKLVGPVAVKLELPPGYSIHPVFHVSLVKPYVESQHSKPPPPVMELDTEGMPVYEVEQILHHRQRTVNRRRTWEFLVKWKHFPVEHNSWEPLANFTKPRPMIVEYWASIGGEPKFTPKIKAKAAAKAQAAAQIHPDPQKRRRVVHGAAKVRVKQSARLAVRGGGV